MTQLEMMNNQLTQVFQYAELLTRLNSVQELLNIDGGYAGEKEIYDMIENLKIEIRKNIEIHFGHSGVSDRARIIVNNMDYLRVHNKKTEEKPIDTKNESVTKRTIKVISEQLGTDVEDISMESDIIDDLGADSLDIVELVMGLEEEFDTQLPQKEIDDMPYKTTKVKDIIELIKSKI
jgi:acyl carrier protein